MLPDKHSGFPLDAGVCIAAHERRARQRLPRDCAGPPFAIERLRKEGSDPVYRCAKQHSDPTTDKPPAPDYEVDHRVNWCGSEAALPTGCGLRLRARLP